MSRERARDVNLYFIGMLLQQAITFGSGVLVARWIGAGDYGVMSIVRNIFALVLVVAPMGLDIGLLKHLPNFTNDRTRWASQLYTFRLISLSFNLLIFFSVAVFGGGAAEKYLYRHDGLQIYLILAFISLPLAADTAILGAALKSERRPAAQIITSLYIQPIARVLALIVVWRLQLGISGVFWATAFGYLVSSTVLSAVIFRTAPLKSFSLLREASLARGAFSYSGWLAASLLVYSVLRNLDIIVLGLFRLPKEVGEYAAMSAIAQVIQIYPQALSQTMGVTVSKLHSDGNYEGIRGVYEDYIRSAILLSAPIFAGVAIFGSWLDLIFGKSFNFSPYVAAWLALGYLLSAVLAPLGYALSMTGKHKQELMILALGALLVLIGSVILAPRWGGAGVAAAVAFGYCGINAARALIVSAKIGFVRVGVSSMMAPVVCVAIAIVFKLCIDALDQRVLPVVALTGVLYLASVFAVYWLILFSRSEKAYFSSRFSRVLRRS